VGICLLMVWGMAPVANAGAKIWVFVGDPGDEIHHASYEAMLASMRKSFTETYAMPAEDLRVFYGPAEAGYAGISSREAVLAELGKAAAATHEEACSSVWVFFIGHANSIPGGALFNLPGPDVSPRDIAGALKTASPDKPLVTFLTFTTSDQFLRPLAAPGRIVVAANSAGDEENETDYPVMLAQSLASKSTDTNKDGVVSATEIFTDCHSRIERMNTQGGYVIREHGQMDGDGDGRGTNRPAPADAEPGSKVGLRIDGGNAAPGKPGSAFD